MLQVSPAAVSNAVRYLQQVRLAVREREPGERRDHYRLYNDTWYEAVTHKDEMLKRWQEDMWEGIEAVGADTPAGRRLEETRRFYAFLLDEKPRLMERWRKVRSESAAEGGV
jgi:DNA-binding transcriptional regulator GbsR (MarR family)